MLTKQDITIFFSKAYEKAALSENADMRMVVQLYEDIRGQVNIDDPYDWWDFILLDRNNYDNEKGVELLRDLKEFYYSFYFEKLITDLDIVFKENNATGLKQWHILYAEAAVHFKEDLLCMLCIKRLQWRKAGKSFLKYIKLSKLIQESRWPDAYPYYVEIAANKDLTEEVRGYAELTLLQIILHHYPETSNALKHLENAMVLLPDHFLVKRAWGEYYFKTGDPEKARNSFLQVITMKPGDYLSLNYIGDSVVSDTRLENAESWYTDALEKNFLQTDTYSRMISLYGNKLWIKEKEKHIDELLDKIEKRNRFANSRLLTKKKIAETNCFKDLALYQSYRDVGASYFTNEEMIRSAEWYTKAWQLQPTFATALIDLAYLQIHQDNFDKAQHYFDQALELDKENFEVQSGLAYLYEKQNKDAEAIKAYEQCLKLRPDWSDWTNNFIGKIYFKSGDFIKAASCFRKSVETNEHYLLYRQNLADALKEQADILVKDKKINEAAKLYLAAAKTDDDVLMWNTLGNFYYQQSRWKDALECYDKCIALQNEEPVYYENRGLALEKMKEIAEAEKSYKAALNYDSKTGKYFNRLGFFFYEHNKYDEAIKYYLKALERNPDELVYLENICIAYEKMGQLDKAEPFYLKQLEIDSKNNKILNLLGILYYKRNDYDNALKYYNEAIKQNSEYAVYHENVAILYRSIQKIPEAIAAFEAALKLDGSNEINWNDAGVLYYKQGNYDKAITYYSEAIKLNSKAPLYYENMGSAYDAKKDTSNAISHYNKSLKIKPDNAGVLNTIGLIHYRENALELAVEFYKKAVVLEANNWVYQTNLALALRLLKRADEAIEVLRKAVELNKDDYLNWNDLGILLYEKGKVEEAIDCYNKSINLQPDDAVLYVNLALAFNSIGKTAEAINISSDSRLKEEVKLKLQELMQQYIPSFNEVKAND